MLSNISLGLKERLDKHILAHFIQFKFTKHFFLFVLIKAVEFSQM